MDEIRWEEPPAPTRWGMPVANHADVAAKLRERPGRWAIVSVYSTHVSALSVAYQIRSGKLAAYRPKGAFEASARTVDGEHRVYARFVGDAS